MLTAAVDVADSDLSGCNYFWTAGQRYDISRKSRFVWKIGTSSVDDMAEMSYTNWNHDQPDYSGNNEICMHLNKYEEYKWNDIKCDKLYCSVCEVDL